MGKRTFLAFITLSIIFFYSIKRFEEIQTFEIKAEKLTVFEKVGLEIKKDNSGKFYYGLSELKPSYPLECEIDFEEKKLNLDNYEVLYSKFLQEDSEKFGGNFSGKFLFSDDFIALKPTHSSIFYPSKDVGSFTIEFWLFPYKAYDEQQILWFFGEDLSAQESKKCGFGISVKDGKLIYRFENFFWDAYKTKTKELIELSEEDPLILYKWEHHSISYDSRNGRLTIFRNGVEEKSVWVTESGEKDSKIFYPYVSEYLNTPIFIGRRSFILMDNFRIIRSSVNSYKLKRLYDKVAYITTPVFRINDNIFKIKNLFATYKSDEYSFLKFSYRISPEVFAPYDRNLPWISVNLSNFNIPEEFSAGRYIQFRLTVYPETTKEDFRLYSFGMKYSLDESPYTPHIVRYIPFDGGVEIQWIPSPEDDIAGYEIYYGNESKNYICKDAKEGASPIFVKKSKEGFEIEKFRLTLPNESPYFISIRAVDKNGHRSKFSSEIFVRPSSIFNENGFTIEREKEE